MVPDQGTLETLKRVTVTIV